MMVKKGRCVSVSFERNGLVAKLSSNETGFVDPTDWNISLPVNYLPHSLWGYFQDRARVMYRELKSGFVMSGGLTRIDAYSGYIRNPTITTNPNWYRELFHDYEYLRSSRKKRSRINKRKKSTRLGPTQSVIRKNNVLNSLKRIAEGRDGRSTKYKNNKAFHYSYDQRVRQIILSFILDGTPVTDSFGNIWRYHDPLYTQVREKFDKGLSDQKLIGW